jgi:uncharacterized protein YxjI
MLNRTTWLIKEQVAMLKLADTYDIYCPEQQVQIGVAKERPSTLVHFLRFLVNKQMLPTKVDIHEGDDPLSPPLFSIERGVTFLRNRVNVRSRDGQLLGWFRSKLLSLGGAFTVFDANDNEVATVKGDWKGWNFKFLDGQQNEIGVVTKKWAGLAKEFFTSADSYVISLHGTPNPAKAALLLAAGLAIDIIYKEQ